MKQLQFVFTEHDIPDGPFREIREYYDTNDFAGMFIHIYTEIMDRDVIEKVCRKLDEILPEAQYIGCSSNGNIINGDFSSDSLAMIANFFEYPSTQVRIVEYPMTSESQERVAKDIVRLVEENDWVKGVEFLVTIRGMSMSVLCDTLSEMREGVAVYGGGAFNDDINNNDACVFSKEGGYLEKGIVVALLGGDDLYFRTSYLSGWKPLGSYLDVTSASGPLLKELNGRPAYETYYKYLRIKNDENFFYHTLEFPFLYRYHGVDIMRAPTACTPEGFLVMTSDMESDVRVRLAYGDPWTILDSVRQESLQLLDFAPERITVFSCAGRRTFWGNDEIGQESKFYQRIAPTSGFYTSSEFVRTEGWVNQHNVTQVLVAVREGLPDPNRKVDKTVYTDQEDDDKIPMISRMASFIKVTMEELEEANEKLSDMAITDGLTGLLNRMEIQRRITHAIENDHEEDIYLIMLDLDDFKKVNDNYGHKEGDNVLIRVSSLLKETKVDFDGKCSAGRWGGEEFMILITTTDGSRVYGHANRIRETMEGICFEKAGTVTISIGVTKAIKGEKADEACNRVDYALYEAKRTGKNKIVIV